MNRVHIRAGKADAQYWSDIWHFRELLYFLAWRDIIVRYKQAVFGIAWALIRPILMLFIFGFVGGKLGKFPSPEGVPYQVMLFAAIWPWQFFAGALSESANSLVANSTLVSKIYFPRLLIPIGSLTVAFIDFLFSSVILVALMAWYHFTPTKIMLTLPLFFILAFASASGIGVLLASLNVRFRDVRMIVPFIVQFGFYLSPVMFPVSMIKEHWPTFYLFYYLNPMVSVIEGFRWAITGNDAFAPYWPGLLLSLATIIAVSLIGVWHFRRTEKTLADII